MNAIFIFTCDFFGCILKHIGFSYVSNPFMTYFKNLFDIVCMAQFQTKEYHLK